jgi:hypothetical protein
MKHSTLVFSLLLSSGAFAQALIPPHMDLEMSSEEYAALLGPETQDGKGMDDADDPRITQGLRNGARLSKWIALINSGRTETTAIRLTSPQTRRGIPIDTPSIYSPETVGNDTTKVMAALPAEMKTVLESEGDLPATIALDDATFIKNARLVDKIYQTSARYKSLDGYRYYYISAAAKDVRGYNYLTKNGFNAETLKDVALIPADKVDAVKAALVGICKNGNRYGNCDALVTQAFTGNKLPDLYNRYYPAGQAIWSNFFDIPASGARTDITWTGDVMTVPFNTPAIAKFEPYLRDNIQDEYRFNTWKLQMNFGTFANGPRLVFEAGVVPHVNGLGGNEITMDSNQPIEEYESQWTIRHEFGHVLGLPDCYHEFYDTNLQAYVNYQLDITDLMCSRAGNMTERIFKQLEKNYKK